MTTKLDNSTEKAHTGNVESSKLNGKTISPIFQNDVLSKDEIGSYLKKISYDQKGFPVNAFPDSVKEIIQQTNDFLNFPIDFISASILYAASLAIGNTFALRFKSTWIESVVLYLVLVGRPGSNKSHPITFAINPIMLKDDQYFEEYQNLRSKYDSELMAQKRGEAQEPLKKPLLKKFIISDSTPEAVIGVLSYNKRGIGIYADELAGWIKNFNRYNSGSEQEFYLSNWSGKPIIVDRKSGEPARVSRPCISVIGTIQTSILDELAKDNRSQNGFIDRLLFVRPNDVKRLAWSFEDIDISIPNRWSQILNRLLNLSFDSDENGKEVPRYLKFSTEARQIILDWQTESVSKYEEFGSEAVDGISSKIDTYALRFSLIIYLLKWACSNNDESSIMDIDAESARSAIMISEYFRNTALEISEHLNNKNPLDRLPEDKRNIYMELKNQFEMAEGLQLTKGRIHEKTFKNWVKDDALFKRVKQGVYQKVFTT